jgi:flagellar hook-associated protein 3 FlgL
VATGPYAAGTTLAFDGIAFQVSGKPAAGDSLEVKAVTAPTDLFQVVQGAIDALKGATSGQSAELVHTLGRSLTEIDAAHDRVLAARSQTGAWLNRADSIDSVLTRRELAQKSEKSDLEDLDMVQGVSDFKSMETGLQAAMATYAQVQKLSLFQYVS